MIQLPSGLPVSPGAPDPDAVSVHAMSPFSRAPFLVVPCAAGLLLSLLFGTSPATAAAPPGCPLPVANGTVHALTTDSTNGLLYVAGNFTGIDGTPRNHLAAIDLGTCAVTAWNPNPNGAVRAMWLSEDDATLYAGGEFTAIGGLARGRLAAVSTANGLPTPWAPNANGDVHALLPSANASTFYIAGAFTTLNTALRHGFVEISRLNGIPISPRFDFGSVDERGVYALALGQDRLYLAGDFTGVTIDFSADAGDDATPGRAGLAAIDLAPGYPLSDWNPGLDSGAPSALRLAPDGGVLYVGGDVFETGGVTQPGILALDADTGARLPWDPRVDGPVHAIQPSLDRSILYLGGAFTTVGTLPRDRLAAVRVVDASLIDEGFVIGGGPDPVCALHRTEDRDAGDYRLHAGGGDCADGAGGVGLLEAFAISPPESTPPLTRALPPGGLYGSGTVTPIRLECDDFDGAGCAETRYTTDGSLPDEDSTLYEGPIPMIDGLKLRFYSIDHVGNAETPGDPEVYEVETRPPVTIAIPGSRVYDSSTLTVILSCRDDVIIDDPGNVPGDLPDDVPGEPPDGAGGDGGDPPPGIGGVSGCADTYYTTDGSIPTVQSRRYEGPITISGTTVVMFFSTDVAGNIEAVQRQEYVQTRSEIGALSGIEIALGLALATWLAARGRRRA